MILSDIFKKAKVSFDKLLDYGFIEKDSYYLYSEKFMDCEFLINFIVYKDGKIESHIIEVEQNMEYLNIENKNMNGEFVNKVREEYKKILEKIRDNCFIVRPFIFEQTNKITSYICEKYKDNPEFLWEKDDNTAVFRNKKNMKWYGIVMLVDESKIKECGKEKIEVINVKINKDDLDELLKINGIYKAYHMNKLSWITIVLDDTLSFEIIKELVDKSYNLVNG